MQVSQTDIDYLKVIRKNVRNHIWKALSYYRDGDRVLDIAPQVHQGAKEFFEKVETLDIEPGADHQADICEDNSDIIPNNTFDIIICTEVLEHVSNPFDAVKELHRMLKPGGLLFLTTPFNFRIHGPLPDNWRFTEHGLRQLFNGWHINISEIGSDRFLMPVHYSVTAQKKHAHN